MATLLSPGVDVEITDESFYTSSGPGTVPLIVFATQANKASPTGSGISPGTVPGTAGKLYNITSQRELIQTFGNPFFDSVQGTTVVGSELNEYGLHAAYQYLGISSSVYVLRADIDLAALEPAETAPAGAPVNGTVWFDTTDTLFGAFQSSGSTNANPFSVKNVTVINSPSLCDVNNVPLSAVGTDGDLAVVTCVAPMAMYERINTNNVSSWYLVGSSTWKFAKNIIRSSTVITAATAASVLRIALSSDSTKYIDVTVNIGDALSTVVGSINTAAQGSIIDTSNHAMSTVVQANAIGGRLVLNFTQNIVLSNTSGTATANLGLTAGTYTGVQLTFAPHTKIPQGSVQGDIWIKTTTPNSGANYVVKTYSATTGNWSIVKAPFYVDDNTATAASNGAPATNSIYVMYDVNSDGSATTDLRIYNGAIWADLNYEASSSVPTTAPVAGTLWYNDQHQVDIMVSDSEDWYGYRNTYPATDANGVIVAGSAPLTQSLGGALVDNDIWLDSSDTENYPSLYRYTASTQTWTLIDNTDQTTENGIVFLDARQDSGPTYSTAASNYAFESTLSLDMVKSNFVDPDAPDPTLYPRGTLLFNTRYSTLNVKQWQPNWFKRGGFDANTDFTLNAYNVGDFALQSEEVPKEFPPLANAGRWVTASGNDVTGAPFMGRKAQRQMIVKALAAQFVSNQDIRSEIVYFNLIACPGYTELLSDMKLLNTDCKEVAFIIGDTPARLSPDATTVGNWATNANNVATDGDNGLVTHDANIGLYYPWGFSTNVDGSNVVVPPSTIALYTYAFNDQIAYPWFAPAGYTRGLVSNATSVGYINASEEFQTVILNPGQRDTLYTNSINPIAYIPGRGLVVYGQKTLNPIAEATDRVNVARLCNYLRYQLDLLAKPFLFEQNDLQTRDAFKVTLERFLSGLVGLQALTDFAVVCDTSNNTPERIDANELWADILIQPVKAIEFIYLPVRILNTGATLSTS
jgi:Phage tail sheath C-terminal domain